ncbi:IS3 family transposase [Marinomonas sp. GJ51-6]|uniref:IS3 family transposase n=1 Tax=Marinomonas sp. GJ51-6 TaxID=2992802 RepID=UPI002934F60D|nr:IS3 family transposase [Marinomonas sp. GJ51-6]WOD09270.1 IS3 family transposase [Marinomonas sp. GJ51-6]WOD09304.1 IS3 family transposase [Marinomonas sp. GJ51-6]WOD09344.1 IS3 family transposase [Marinomonas sp. GJ51-6]WOD09375.1 IS3 family transposase [Marinomonas sp. GJ51-6]WOD09380.1 IS3 family transposase [Marinomonas sp. GJ51-6]
MVQGLRSQFKLANLLRSLSLPRSVFYYQSQRSLLPDPYAEVKEKIQAIFHEHKGRYGYRRITATLRRTGMELNHKTVQRLMKSLGLKSKVRPKRYRSYRGDVGRIADNLLCRSFKVNLPNEKWVTDVTEFNIKGQKVYLSPVIDLFNQEVIAFQVKKSAHLPLVTDMLQEAISTLKKGETPILHSDQGWQYQQKQTRHILKKHGLPQSMSRKGNCLDNAVAENFFALLKTEMFHGEVFENADDLIQEIEEYIDYYNTKRIKMRLNGLTPVEYRNQALLAD